MSTSAYEPDNMLNKQVLPTTTTVAGSTLESSIRYSQFDPHTLTL